jgi:RHS repeat-associated protein
MTEKSMGPSSTTWFYGYNDKNQMTSAIEKTSPTGTALSTVTYDYDVFGNMIEEDVNTGGTTTVTRYALDGWDPGKPAPVGNENFDQLFHLNGSNALVMRYVNGDNVDQVWARISSAGTAAWYWEDRLGSVRFMTENSGVVQDQINYDGFGNVTNETAPTFGDQNKGAGLKWDSPIGQYRSAQREYNPLTGMWDQVDPMGFAAGDSSLSRYVANDPVNGTDPSGQELLAVGRGGRQYVGMQLHRAGLRENVGYEFVRLAGPTPVELNGERVFDYTDQKSGLWLVAPKRTLASTKDQWINENKGSHTAQFLRAMVGWGVRACLKSGCW